MSDFSNFVNMTTPSGTILLNAGLPWTNPLKIQIGSDEHIIDTTINRGLMMLLNNDYYLDAKSSVLSKELSSVIDNVDTLKNILQMHVNDESIHGQKQLTTTIQNITNEIIGDAVAASYNYNDDKLQGDTIKYLSISWSAAKINSVIRNTPHNLNTYTLIFLFVVPNDYSGDDYICNVENECIEFSNFYNGTLFVQGDYLHKSAKDKNPYAPKPRIEFEKTAQQINDPINFDGVNLKKYIANLENELLYPEEINDIIDSESGDTALPLNNKLKKIKIFGSALNESYSVMALKNISARAYVKNLSFMSSLKQDSTNKDVLLIEDFGTKANLPTNERLLLFYPLDKNLEPTVGYAIKNQINATENAAAVGMLESINELVSASIESISSNVFGTSGLIDQFDSQIKILTHPVQNVDKNYLLTSGQILTMKEKFEDLSDTLLTLSSAMLEPYISAYTVDGEFKNDDFTSKLMTYQKAMLEYREAVSAKFDYSGLQGFIFDRSDLAQELNFTSGSFDSYKNVYLVSSLELITSAVTSSNFIFGSITNWMNEDLKDVFKLTPGDNIKENFTSGQFNEGFDKYVDFNDDDNICYSLENGASSYFELSPDVDKRNKFLFDAIFEDVEFNNIRDKLSGSTEQFTSSNRGATICFWVRKNDVPSENNGYLEFNLSKSEKTTDETTQVTTTTTKSFNLLISDTKTHVISNVISGNIYDESELDYITENIANKEEWSMFQYSIDAHPQSSVLIQRKIYSYELDEYSNLPKVKIKESEVFDINKNMLLEKNDYTNYKMILGRTVDNVGNAKYEKYLNGRIRNLSIFVGPLTESESLTLFSRGIKDYYDLPYENNSSSLSELIGSNQFYLGLLGVYSVDNINILNCVMKYKGKSYSVIS